MAQLFWTTICFFMRSILSLRYRIELKGRETLGPDRLKRKGGILFLPNHPAHMDPLMILLFLWPRYRIRPVVIEYIYRQPWMRPLMKLVNALSIPNFETSINQIKIKKAEETISKIAEGLKRGEHFLLYPAGRLKYSGKELVGGSSAAHALVQEAPDTNVVLIRTTGLWGSSFSRALTGKSPELGKNILRGIGIALKNLIFFIPRRPVQIEIEGEPADLPRVGERLDFNRALEHWYNRYPNAEGVVQEEEPVTLVSYSFWRKELPQVFQPRQRKGGAGAAISPEIQEKIAAEIARIIEKPKETIRPEMHLAFDLGMDSLQIAELISYVGQHFDVQELHPEDLETVQSVLEVAEGARLSEKPVHQVVHVHWPKELHRLPPLLPVGQTIPEAFLNCCDRMGSSIACGDDLIGAVSYKKLKRSVLVLADQFRSFPEERIGVLLPASVGAFVVILAIQCARKVPVMLNWTLGPRALDDMVHTAKVSTVISSWRFLERLSHVDFGEITDKIKLLEDIRQEITLQSKLRGAILAYFGAKTVLHSLGLHLQKRDVPAVVLFTSGTEAAPKGVPLSHWNILSNLRSGMQCMDLRRTDILYGILPPFHSFGFSVAGLFSLLGGMKIAFYPDPTDSFALAEGIKRWGITIFCSAPSFLKGLFAAAKAEQLTTVRYFVTGAEKTPAELYKRVSQLGTGAKIIEGYGITECSPILSMCRPNLPSKGVGRPLADVSLCTIHPETQELLPQGREGEICVRGPSVFNGYLNAPSPFIEIEGKKWYRTGDLGYLDAEGNLILSGRLKRFTKIGGEMISLGAIEEALTKGLIQQGRISPDVPAIAVCADEREKEGKQPQLILFTTVQMDKEAANDILRQQGVSRLAKISSVQQIEDIPLLGTGKTDYRRLQTTIT